MSEYLLREIVRELQGIRMGITNLETSVATLTKNVQALIAAEAGSVPQAQVDAVQANVDALNATVVAALNPPAPAA